MLAILDTAVVSGLRAANEVLARRGLQRFPILGAERGGLWWSRQVGAWRVIGLDSQRVGSTKQRRWLTRQLKRHDGVPTLVMWHRPRFSRGMHDDQRDTAPLYRLVKRDRDVKLLIAAQPTRGIDVGSIEFIHKQIVAKRDEGVAVLVVSAELDEIMALADRIAVMYRGEIVAVVPREEATREELGLLMAGVDPDEVGVNAANGAAG